MPKKNRSSFCHHTRILSSPRNEYAGRSKSRYSGSFFCIRNVGITVATMEGRTSAALKLVGVTAPLPHTIRLVTSPITVQHPPQLAAIAMAEPIYILCLPLRMILRRIISISTVTVRLSMHALSMNVIKTVSQSICAVLLRLSHFSIKEKHSLLVSTSTMDMVARRYNTSSATCPT